MPRAGGHPVTTGGGYDYDGEYWIARLRGR